MHKDTLRRELTRIYEELDLQVGSRGLDRLARVIEKLSSAGNGQDQYGSVCVDFDGVIAEYDGWKGHGVIGRPYAHARDLLQRLRVRFAVVIVHSTRGAGEIWDWLHVHGLHEYVDRVNLYEGVVGNNTGKPVAEFYIDDRAIRFTGDVNALMREIEEFREWWKPDPSDKENDDAIQHETANTGDSGNDGF